MITSMFTSKYIIQTGLLVPRLIGPTCSDPHHSRTGQGVKVTLGRSSTDCLWTSSDLEITG